MPASVWSDRGLGPVVVLVHGVGAGPATFAPVAALLEDRHRVIVVERPVADGGPGSSLADQADAVTHLLEEVGAVGGRLVGVSGGATLGLVLAERHPHVVADLVLHEPLLGRLVPGLHRRFQAAAAAARTGDDAALQVVIDVMGAETWARLGDAERSTATQQASRWRHDIAGFAAFDPTPEDLSALTALSLLVTTGSRSDDDRRAVADTLHHLARADLATVPDSGNAAQVDAPAAFADLVATWQPEPVGDRR